MTDDDSSLAHGKQDSVAGDEPSSTPDDGDGAPRARGAIPDDTAAPIDDLAPSSADIGPDDAAPSTTNTQLADDTTTPRGRFVTDYVPPPPVPQFKNRRRLTAEEAAAQRRRRAVRRRRRRIAGFSLLGVGACILLAAGWVGWRTYQAYQHLQAASEQVSQLQGEIKDITSIDLAAANATVARLQDESAQAQAAVGDPLYRAAAHVPFLGPNLMAISEVTGTVDSLAVDVVPSLVQIAKTLNPSSLAPKNSVIDLAPIEAASPLLQEADAAVNASRVRLASIDRTKTVEQINSAILTLWRKLDQASSITGAGARVARLLPPMLGADGPRTYLVAFQNLAEVRATGGIFGSFATVRVDNGKISIVDRGRASKSIGTFQAPIEQLDAKTTALWSNLMALFPQDVNMTPDFPTAAALFAKMYTIRKGTAIDGVIATDPVALSYALKGTGPINVGDGITLTSQNIVSTLLSDAYLRDPSRTQSARDTFLASATTLAFEKVVSGGGNASVTMAGYKQAVQERRVLVWSRNAAEQADIAQTGLVGRLGDTAANPSIGVFLNDGTQAKLDYYLSKSVTVTPGECQADGRRVLQVKVTMSFAGPRSGLPGSVLGDRPIGQMYMLQTNVMVFAPVGGGAVAATRDGKPTGVQRGENRGREVLQVPVRLTAGGKATIDVSVLAPFSTEPVGTQSTLAVVMTPGVHVSPITAKPYGACGAAG